MTPAIRTTVALLLVLGLAASGAAEVSRVEIRSREPFDGGVSFGVVGAYEKIVGRLHYVIDPANPANGRIVDLRYAPRNEQGKIAFVGDFILLKPVDLQKGNHRLIYDVSNRGGWGGIVSRLNEGWWRERAGNGFLMKQGYSLLWSAWNWDVVPGRDTLQIELPIATDHGRPITGEVVVEIVVPDMLTATPSKARSLSEPLAWGGSRSYEAANPGDTSTATLTVRDEQRDKRVPIPRDRWRFARVENGEPVPDVKHLYLASGFEPGRIYELVYVAKDPRVVGLGLAAIRDAISFFRFAAQDSAGSANPLGVRSPEGLRPDPEKAYIFGISQSGRVIQHMIFEGFHVDEAGRMVFDAAMPHVSGAGKGSFNHRFAQTTRVPTSHEEHQYPADFFPFSSMPQTDPVTGQTADVLAVAKKMGKVPYVMVTQTSTEYWMRSASLLHTDVTGTKDAVLDDRVRIYLIAGGQHMNGARTSPFYHHPGNPLNHSAPLRALLVALDRWATDGSKPPDSQYPRIDRGEAVRVEEHRRRFPKIPGSHHPGTSLQAPRLDFGPRFWSEGVITIQPPRYGESYVALVPNVDEDGNEASGIRLPDVAVPLGTYMGWNPRSAEFGGPHRLARWMGSFLVLPATEADRQRTGDPRPSIEARYATKQAYVDRVSAAVEKLRAQRLLLDEDATAMIERSRAIAWSPRQ